MGIDPEFESFYSKSTKRPLAASSRISATVKAVGHSSLGKENNKLYQLILAKVQNLIEEGEDQVWTVRREEEYFEFLKSKGPNLSQTQSKHNGNGKGANHSIYEMYPYGRFSDATEPKEPYQSHRIQIDSFESIKRVQKNEYKESGTRIHWGGPIRDYPWSASFHLGGFTQVRHTQYFANLLSGSICLSYKESNHYDHVVQKGYQRTCSSQLSYEGPEGRLCLFNEKIVKDILDKLRLIVPLQEQFFSPWS